MNKYAQQGEKDAKASGLKIMFEISNTNKYREKEHTKLSFRSQDPVWDLKQEQMQREKRHQIKLQVLTRPHLRSQIWTCAKRKRHQWFRSQGLIWDLKYEQPSGLKISFEISNTNQCREKKTPKLQVSRSHLRSQIRTCATRKKTPKIQVSTSRLRSQIRTDGWTKWPASQSNPPPPNCSINFL